MGRPPPVLTRGLAGRRVENGRRERREADDRDGQKCGRGCSEKVLTEQEGFVEGGGIRDV
jgi:hypothetical protein